VVVVRLLRRCSNIDLKHRIVYRDGHCVMMMMMMVTIIIIIAAYLRGFRSLQKESGRAVYLLAPTSSSSSSSSAFFFGDSFYHIKHICGNTRFLV